MTYLFQWYTDLALGGPVTYTEIDCWSRLTGTPIEPQEVDLLKRLDHIRNRS